MKTTKGGKVMNPTDAFRKEQRKREIKRNKMERQKVREAGILKKDPEQIKEQIRKLEMSKAEGALDKARKHKKRQLEDTLKMVVKKRKEYEEKKKEQGEGSSSVMFSHLPPQRRATGEEDLKPEDSVYYHPLLNPTGAPPPGKPPMYNSSIGPRIPAAADGASSSGPALPTNIKSEESHLVATPLPPLPEGSDSLPLPPLPPLPPTPTTLPNSQFPPPPKEEQDLVRPPLPPPPPLPQSIDQTFIEQKVKVEPESGPSESSLALPPPPPPPQPLLHQQQHQPMTNYQPQGMFHYPPPPPPPLDMHPMMRPPYGQQPMMRPPLPPGPPPPSSFQDSQPMMRPYVPNKPSPSFVKSAAPTVVKRPLAQHTPALTSMVPASVRVRRESAVVNKPKPKSSVATTSLSFTPRAMAASSAAAVKVEPAKTSVVAASKPKSVDDSYSAFLEDMKALGALDG